MCSRTESTLYKTLEELMNRFPDVTIRANPFDISKKEDAQAFGKWILGLNISIDVLVNNAGSFEPGSVYNEPDNTLENMMAVNLLQRLPSYKNIITENDGAENRSYF